MRKLSEQLIIDKMLAWVRSDKSVLLGQLITHQDDFVLKDSFSFQGEQANSAHTKLGVRIEPLTMYVAENNSAH